MIWNQEEGTMSTLAERVKQWGDELNREWLEEGIEFLAWAGEA